MTDEYGRRSLGTELSVELAERDPDAYTQLLIEQLGTDTKLTGEAWRTLREEGVFDQKTIVLQPGTWVSETRKRSGSDAFTITLGTKPLSPEEKRRLIFDETRIHEKIYLLSHEISHVVAGQASQRTKNIRNLYAVVKQMRAAGNGLSALGNLDFYKRMGPEEQAKEDVVELVNMHLIDPEYLKKYLAFLSDPSMSLQRAAVGVVQIDATGAEHIERVIAKGVAERLSR